MEAPFMENVEDLLAETPEDVATLYSWANLRGAKYRDFSASRREYRAQVRHRAAEELRQAELAAKLRAETAATEDERMAREAERAAHAAAQSDSEAERENAMRTAEEAERRARAERAEAERRGRSAEVAEAAARWEEREIAEAQALVQRRSRTSYADVRRRFLGRPQTESPAPGQTTDPYRKAHADLSLPERAAMQRGGGERTEAHPTAAPVPNRRMDPEARIRFRDLQEARRVSGERGPAVEGEADRSSRSFRLNDSSRMMPAYRPTGFTAPQMWNSVDRFEEAAGGEASSAEQPGPAWLYASRPGLGGAAAAPVEPPSVPQTNERERGGARWFSLQGSLAVGPGGMAEAAAEARRTALTPTLAVFSLAGGVGKTSLVATLARALSSFGEKVLLAESTAHGLLPFYFGASELRPGVVRTFTPPSGSTDAPVQLASYDAERTGSDPARQDALVDEILRSATSAQRLLVDVNAGSGWMLRRLARSGPTMLVPLGPDMNSVISLQAVERCFEGLVGRDGRPVLPYYVLNQFDGSLALHRDVREVLRRQLGERLLPFAVRRAPAVSEALAEGMTVLDYAQETGVAEDFLQLCGWLRSLSAPAAHGFRKARWSER